MEELRKVALAAAKEAPGEWWRDDTLGEDGRGRYRASAVFIERQTYGSDTALIDTINSDATCIHEDEDGRWDEPGRIITAHIATFDPPTILRLLSALEGAEAENSKLRDMIKARETLSTGLGIDADKLAHEAALKLAERLIAAEARAEKAEQALAEAVGWRDISSAPRDGTRIMLAWSREDWTTASAIYRNDEWVACPLFYDMAQRAGTKLVFREMVVRDPLLWAPLPPAPNSDGGRG